MAQTKRKRKTKHRGTQAGTVESRGRTGRRPTQAEGRKITRDRRKTRLDRPPTWRSALNRDAILLTHTHIDHVGAVAPVANATGAEVWVPEIERSVLADINRFVPLPDLGPFESWEAEHTLSGGERLELAGFEIDVLFTPGHSPGHVTYSVADEEAVFSGDVLFKGS